MDCDFNDKPRGHPVNWIWYLFIGYFLINQEIICDLRNGSTRVIFRMHYKTWPRKYDP